MLKDELKAVPLHNRAPVLTKHAITVRGPRFTGDSEPCGFRDEWELSATVAIRFWATSAERTTATKIALRAISSRLYADVLRLLPELRLAISDGDLTRAMDIANEIENATKLD